MRRMRGWGEQVTWMTSTSVPDVILAFFLGGAVGAIAVSFTVLAFNIGCFQFLPSGIVFAGSMSAIFFI